MRTGRRACATLMKLAQVQQSTGDLERCSATLLEAIDLVPGDDLALRLRLTSACAACENFLGRHEPAERRLVAALEALPDQGSREAVAVLLDLATGAFFTSSSSGCATWPGAGSPPLAPSASPRSWRRRRPCSRTAARTPGWSPRRARTPTRPARVSTSSPTTRSRCHLDAVSRLAWAEYLIERFDDSIRHAARGVRRRPRHRPGPVRSR